MRVSHKEIRRRIYQEQLKITDEELFSSAAFAAYLTDIAETATGRYKRKIGVMTFYDISEGAKIAYTDNKRIAINAGNHITRSFPSRILKADSLIGLNAHEIGHILFTNFELASEFITELQHGRMYPEVPNELSEAEKDSLDEMMEMLQSGTGRTAIAFLSKQLLNVLEDGYIEARMCDAFPGKFATGIRLNDIRFTEMVPSISEQIADGNFRFAILHNLLIQYCRCGEINNRDGYEGEMLDLFYELIPIIDDAIYSDDIKQRFNAVNRIMLAAWDYVKEISDHVKEEQEENLQSNEEALEKIFARLKQQAAESAEDPEGDTAPIVIKSPLDRSIQKDAEQFEALKNALSEERERIALHKTEDFDEGGSGGIELDNLYEGLGYQNAGEDILRVLSSVAEEKVNADMSEMLSEELAEAASEIRLGNAHKGVKIRIHRTQEINDIYVKQYYDVAPPLVNVSRQMQKRLHRIFRDTEYVDKQSGLIIGRRVEPRLLIDREGKFFSKRILPGEKKSLAVALLIDESGSMCGERAASARAAAIIVYDFCKAMNIPVSIMGHTDCGDVDMYAYTDFDSCDANDRYRLMDISARDGNRDGAALRYIAERLMKQPEQNKLLMLISDGQPAGSGGYSGTAAEADLRGIKKEYMNKGILFVAAAIGSDKANIERIYGDAFLDITDLNKLPFLLVRKIEKELRG